LLITLIYRRFPAGIWWLRIFLLGIVNIGLFFGFLFYATYKLSGGVVATVGATQPLLVILFFWLVFQQPITWFSFFAALSGLAGVGMLAYNPEAPLIAPGIVSAVVAAVGMAMGVVLTKRWIPDVPLLLFTG
jgi:probable blue pigment (indigoidine) exporter